MKHTIIPEESLQKPGKRLNKKIIEVVISEWKAAFTKLAVFLILLIHNSLLFAQSVEKQRLEKHVYTLASDSFKGRHAGSEDAGRAAEYIVAQWKSIGLQPYRDNNYFQPFDYKYKNIIAVLPGSDSILKNEYIIVGAHYDHIGYRVVDGDTIVYNGADDNASGVAAITELGRKLKVNPSGLKRSIILIAFDAEELGLYGSKHFVKEPVVPLDKIKLMFSVDMVGWYKTSGFVEYSGVATIADGAKILSDKRLTPATLNVTTKDFETSIFTATDTEPFAKTGIPTLAVTTGLKSPYHKPEDDADLIDYDGLALITEHLENLVRYVSSDGTYRKSGKVARKHRTQSVVLGITAGVGSNYHHYTDGALDGKNAPVFVTGLTAQFNKGYFAIRPEILYEYQKAKYPAGNIATNNITLPLSFVLQTQDGVAGVFLGGYYTHRLSGTVGDDRIDFSNLFYRNEGGIQYGASVTMLNFRLSYTYRLGLTNFTRFKNDNAHIRNRTGYVSLSYFF